MSTGGMRVFPSSMAISSTSGYAASHAATISAMRGPVNHDREFTSETVGRADGHFDGYRSVYRGSSTDGKASGSVARPAFRAFACSDASMPKVSWKPRRPNGVTLTAWLRVILSIHPG